MVANNTRNIMLLYNKENEAIIFASEFPKNLRKNIYNFKSCCIWNNEAINENLIKKYVPVKQTTVKDLYDYYGFDDYYGQCYFKALNKEGEKYAVWCI